MTLACPALPGLITAQATFESPLGPVLLARTRVGLAGAWFAGQRHHPPRFDAPHALDDLLRAATDRLRAYFDGAAPTFDFAIDLQGTPFQRAVWQSLLEIDSGTTCSYGELARRVGRPTAVRAVGAAVGRNPLSIFVPCHRVVGGDGSLTGYAGGIERKRALLRLEEGMRIGAINFAGVGAGADALAGAGAGAVAAAAAAGDAGASPHAGTCAAADAGASGDRGADGGANEDAGASASAGSNSAAVREHVAQNTAGRVPGSPSRAGTSTRSYEANACQDEIGPRESPSAP
jgi:methylated-DNA-[protein]-cysteine S-methyltransferase